MAVRQSNLRPEPAVHLIAPGSSLLELAPICDVHAKSLKLKTKRFAQSTGGRFWQSGLFHAMAVVAIVAGKYIIPNNVTPVLEQAPIEVSFGQATPSKPVVQRAEPVEATKEPEQLPQVAKNLVVDTELAQSDDLVVPKTVAKKIPVEIEKKKPVEKPDQNETPSKKPIADKTPPPGKTKISAEDMAKRLQRENRKVGDKDSKTGSKNSTSDLPPSPLDSGADLPEAPAGLGPGELDGTASASVLSGYSAAAKAHMRRYWKQSDASNFDKNLEVIVAFQVNLFGKVVGEVRIVKSSGNDQFDEEAISQVKQAAPFPELPQELGRTQKIQMRMLPRDIRS